VAVLGIFRLLVAAPQKQIPFTFMQLLRVQKMFTSFWWMNVWGIIVIGSLVGCGRTQVNTLVTYPGGLSRPDRVLIYDFALKPDDVLTDGTIGKRLFHVLEGESKTEEELKVGTAVAYALSEKLVKEIRDLGLPTERATGISPPSGNTLLIKGQFLSIHEGNRLRRLVIGLGVGGTEVKTLVQVYEETAAGRRLVEEFDTTAKSSRKPGMAGPMGVGAAAGRAAASAALSGGLGVATAHRQSVEADAQRTAREVARRLAHFFASQGWLPWSAVPN